LTEALIDFDGALVVVSHDRHLLRSTTDEFYLVHDHKVEPFEGDLDDYQKWLTEEQKSDRQTNEEGDLVKKENNNVSAQDRKEQKRKQAELRAQMQPIKKQLQKEEQVQENLAKQLQMIEQQLSDPMMYEANKKSNLTSLLLQQSQLKSELEQSELKWLDLQQQLEEFQIE
jgi:ATP-binding cassette, subfamily F, member 3